MLTHTRWQQKIPAMLAAIVLFFSVLPPANAEQLSEQPPGSVTSGRWIDVNLTSLTATAYQGETPVYSAPVTAGKPGYETPIGIFQISYRVISETMKSDTLGVPTSSAEGYDLSGVKYTQYFKSGGYALHGNYWSPDWVFGRQPVSHGCVSMRNSDASYFWSFATYGTPVVIHRTELPTVESVVGMTSDEARMRLESKGYRVQTTEKADDSAAGTVISQQPDANTRLPGGGSVSIVVSAGKPAPTPPPVSAVRSPEGNDAWVPEVVGLPEDEARQRIEQAGLRTVYANYQSESDVPEDAREFVRSIQPGHVLSTDVPAGTRVVRNATILIAVRKS